MRLFPFVRGGTLHTAIPAGPQSWQPLSRRKEEAIKKRNEETVTHKMQIVMMLDGEMVRGMSLGVGGWLETKARK